MSELHIRPNSPAISATEPSRLPPNDPVGQELLATRLAEIFRSVFPPEVAVHIASFCTSSFNCKASETTWIKKYWPLGSMSHLPPLPPQLYSPDVLRRYVNIVLCQELVHWDIDFSKDAVWIVAIALEVEVTKEPPKDGKQAEDDSEPWGCDFSIKFELAGLGFANLSKAKCVRGRVRLEWWLRREKHAELLDYVDRILKVDTRGTGADATISLAKVRGRGIPKIHGAEIGIYVYGGAAWMK